jgi:hypothetical protein
MRRRLRADSLPGTYERRVFIGGDYDYIAILRMICGFVRSTGFTPILASDFYTPRSETHDYALRLLHNCKFAIIEATRNAGQLMELERIRDYATTAFVAYQVWNQENGKPPRHLTSMAATYGIPLIPYGDFSELRKAIKDMLTPFRNKETGKALLEIMRHQWLPGKTKIKLLKAMKLVGRENAN